ncbi:MAG: response regulator [Patescibacteria group bacterium]
MKILLIEDDAFFREFYAHKFAEKNVLVEQAANGEEGLQKITTVAPDVILLDLVMPKKDGFDVLVEMGKLGLLNKIPVLVFSTLGQPDDIERARELGAKGFVNKSFYDFEKLYARLLEISKKLDSSTL